MRKEKIASAVFFVLAFLIVVGTMYSVLNYVSNVVQAIIDFVISQDYQKLQACGVTPPEEFVRLKSDFPQIIIPALYWGIPLIFFVVFVLAFLAGVYYQKGKHEDERELEAKMHEAVKKLAKDKRPKVEPQDTEG